MLAIADGWWIVFGVIVVLIFFGTVIGYYTRFRNPIGQHPIDDRGQSPGARGPSRISSAEPEDPSST